MTCNIDVIISCTLVLMSFYIESYCHSFAWFALIFTARRHASVVYAVVVCLFVTSGCYTVTAKCRITQITPLDSQRTLVLFLPKISAKLRRGHSQRRRQMQVGLVKIGDFRQISRYSTKTSTVASFVNLVRSQVYHTERPPLFEGTFAVMQRVARVRQRQMILVLTHAV